MPATENEGWPRIVDLHAPLMRCDLFAIERAIADLKSEGMTIPTATCKACHGMGRQIMQPVGAVCAGCHGAGVVRL